MRTDWRASLAPAAGVFSAPTVYIEVVAVMKCRRCGSARDNRSYLFFWGGRGAFGWSGGIFLGGVIAIDCAMRHPRHLL